ncbi:MAG: HTH-type transcriptional regulator/antitoxin HigA [Arenicella sp.]|jgi:HTH-type transcriptional regulator/antitoxin HigA
MTDLEAKKALLSCPGDTIQETIEELPMSQKELAERMGRSIPKLNELIKGKASITKETAIKLEYVLGIPSNFWLNLERHYQDELLEIEKMEFLASCKEWYKSFPIATMKKWGILPNTQKSEEPVTALLKFFRVASPTEWSTIYKGSPSPLFKIELKHTTEPEAISAWLRVGELQAEKLDLAHFEKEKIKERLDEIQHLCFRMPNDWLSQLQQICAECGIALVYTPCFLKAPIYGASRWIKSGSIPLIQLTDRRKDYGAFWFTFYHELAHILLHGKKDIFIDGLDEIKPDEAKEQEADVYASKKLLTDKELAQITRHGSITTELIKTMSEQLQKHEGILVSQLQRKKLIPYKSLAFTKMKPKVEIKEVAL